VSPRQSAGKDSASVRDVILHKPSPTAGRTQAQTKAGQLVVKENLIGYALGQREGLNIRRG